MIIKMTNLINGTITGNSWKVTRGTVICTVGFNILPGMAIQRHLFEACLWNRNKRNIEFAVNRNII